MTKPENDELTSAQQALQTLVGGGDDSTDGKQPKNTDARQETSTDAKPAAEAPKPQEPQPDDQSDTTANPEEEAALGDKGKRALDRMKDSLQKANHTIADLNNQISQLKSENMASKIQQAASGRLAHPELAMKLLDTSNLDATDQKAVDAALDDLLKRYPDLGVRQEDDNSLASLFGGVQHPNTAESRTKTNAAVFGAQLDALGF